METEMKRLDKQEELGPPSITATFMLNTNNNRRVCHGVPWDRPKEEIMGNSSEPHKTMCCQHPSSEETLLGFARTTCTTGCILVHATKRDHDGSLWLPRIRCDHIPGKKKDFLRLLPFCTILQLLGKVTDIPSSVHLPKWPFSGQWLGTDA